MGLLLGLASVSALPPPLPPYRCLSLPLTLGAGFLVITALTQFRIQSRALNFPLEAAKRPVQTLVFLNDDFQGRTSTTGLPDIERANLYTVRGAGNALGFWYALGQLSLPVEGMCVASVSLSMF